MPGRMIARWILAAPLALILAAPLAQAEVLKVAPETYSVITEPGLPTRGLHQSQVVARHGQPEQRFATVGGGAPRQPPITRWDYDGFSVVFEGAFVLHSVVHGPHTPQPR